MAEDIAASDTEASEAQETPIASEAVDEKAAKPRKSRARKTATKAEPPAEVVVVDVDPVLEAEPQSTPTVETVDVIAEPAETESPATETEEVIEVSQPKKRAPRKAATKTKKVASKETSDAPVEGETPVATPKPKRKTTTPRKNEAEPAAAIPETPAPVTPAVVYVPVEPDPTVDEEVPNEPPTELTEATKRKRKPKTKLVELPAPEVSPVENKPVAQVTPIETPTAAALDPEPALETEAAEPEIEAPKKPKAKRRTAANAKTAAPRTRKTIKPADDEVKPEEPASPVAESTGSVEPAEQPPKPKRRTRSTVAKTTTKTATGDTAKSTPKTRTRKPKAEKTATDETAKTTAIPDPSAPPVEEEGPLIINTDEAIADSLFSAEPVEQKTEPAMTAALGSDRTVVAPQPVTPTIIERVPPRSSKRLTMTILFFVVGIIGLGAGWALGLASNGDNGTKSKTPTIATIPGQPTPSFPGQQSTSPTTTSNSQAAPTGDLFTLTGSSSRQSALFTLPSSVVQMHYDSSGGTFSAKLLPEAGGDGTTFDCQSACDKEQPIQAAPGRYYFEVQSSGGDWNIHISN